jgi:hypothetical protein
MHFRVREVNPAANAGFAFSYLTSRTRCIVFTVAPPPAVSGGRRRFPRARWCGKRDESRTSGSRLAGALAAVPPRGGEEARYGAQPHVAAGQCCSDGHREQALPDHATARTQYTGYWCPREPADPVRCLRCGRWCYPAGTVPHAGLSPRTRGVPRVPRPCPAASCGQAPLLRLSLRNSPSDPACRSGAPAASWHGRLRCADLRGIVQVLTFASWLLGYRNDAKPVEGLPCRSC